MCAGKCYGIGNAKYKQVDFFNQTVLITEHCIQRYRERFDREVEINGQNLSKRIVNDINKGKCWYSNEHDIIYVVANQLKVYIATISMGVLKIVTVYPYTKRIKHALNKLTRINYSSQFNWGS